MAGKELVPVFIVSAILICSESSIVDTIQKCSVADRFCQKNLLQSVLRAVGDKGIPELMVKPIDPLKIKETHLAALNLVDLTLKEGTVKGVKNCDVLKFILNFDTGHASVEILCNILIKGKYKVSSSSPLLKTILGAESVHGEGNGKVKIEKLKISFDYSFDIIKRDNNLYIQANFDKAKYTYDILDKVQFHADHLYVGNEESSQTIVNVMNKNWKLIMEFLGKNIMDIAMEYIYDFTKELFDKVPVTYFIIEDLSSHVVS